METELQAVATSKEAALMELKSRALKLEEELLQVRLQGPAPPSCLPTAHIWAACALLAPGSFLNCLPRTPLGLLEGALYWELSSWVAISGSALSGQNLCFRVLLCDSGSGPTASRWPGR